MRSLAAAAALAALLLVAALAAQPLAHDDLFGHLATGERIAATGEIPTTDFLSHTRGGERWVSHEWGFSLLAWGVWRVGEAVPIAGKSSALGRASSGTSLAKWKHT